MNTKDESKELILGVARLRIIKGDITEQTTDAIVNAANKMLAPGGGVSGAIHNAAGPLLYRECRSLGGCETGEAKITKGYKLKASYVIHTVGPMYSGSTVDEKLLSSCYKSSLDVALKHTLHSISFPAISTGVFGYPIRKAAEIAVQTTYSWLQKKKTTMIVQFVLFDNQSFKIFSEIVDEIAKRD